MTRPAGMREMYVRPLARRAVKTPAPHAVVLAHHINPRIAVMPHERAHSRALAAGRVA